MEGNAKPLTTGDVAQYCGVSRMGVIRWIRQGKLKAYTTPGGHYRIRVTDFRDFLREFDIPIDASFFGEEPKRILVVASDTSTLGAIVRALSAMSEGYEIDIALDDASAVAAIADFKPAMVILDATMSTVDAPELDWWVKDNLEKRNALTVLLTMPVTRQLEERHLTLTFLSRVSGQSLLKLVPLKTETLQATVGRLLAV